MVKHSSGAVKRPAESVSNLLGNKPKDCLDKVFNLNRNNQPIEGTGQTTNSKESTNVTHFYLAPGFLKFQVF
jgi:hypothetical protein